MPNIILRQGLGNTEPRSANVIVKSDGLSNIELDNNFNNINNAVEKNELSVNNSFTQANTALLQAQAAFAAANNSSGVEPAFNQANTGVIQAQASFLQANSAYYQANTKLDSSGGTVYGDIFITGRLQVDGNVNFSGNVTTVSANNLSVQDNMIYLNEGLSGNTNPDLGFAGAYNDGIYHHTGFFRDASDGIWKVFDNYAPEPDESPYIDITHSTFRIANFKANNIFANTFVSNHSNPIQISSTDLILNLNSDLLDGYQASYFISYTDNAFNKANTGVVQAQASFAQANNEPIAKSAFGQANLAFAQANTSNTNAANASFLTEGTVSNERLSNIPNSSLLNSSITINGTNISLGSSGSITAGATITDDISTNDTRYIMLGSATSGAYTSANVSSTKLTFNPSTGLLSATGFSGSGASLSSIPNAALNNSSVTINGTAISLGSSGTVTSAAGTLTGSTLASGVTGSSLTSVGTITSGTWSGSFGAVSGANLTTLNASNLSSGTVPGDRGVTSGSATSSFVEYNGTTATSGQFDGGSTAPTGTTRLNYGGYFYPTFINLLGSADTATAASHYFVETASDGFVRPKTLTNVQTEIVTSAVLGSGTANSTTFLRGDRTWQTVSGFSTTDDTSTNATYYPAIVTTAGGSTARTSSTKLTFNPSTGTMSSTRFNSLSDENYKENVSTINYGISVVNELNPVKFSWKDTKQYSHGFIAQELEKIIPESVTDENGIKSVDYNSIIPFLVKSIQELSIELDNTKKELQDLKEYYK